MHRKNWIFAAIIICFYSQNIYGQYKEFIYDGIMRQYAVYEPSLDPNPDGYPLLIGLHGAGADGYTMIGTAFLIQKAIAEKFIVASPNALIYNLISWWNAGDGYETITDSTDDLGFISALIDTMIMNYNIDTTRIYILAHSNGSMMAYRVAAELSYRIAAIATNSGQMVYEYCDPEYPVPIIHFHGLEDPICPYEGKGDSIIVIPHADSVMAIWREINGCSSSSDTIYNENGIVGKKWASSSGKSDIVLYTIEGWGHSWPRTVDPGIDATDVMWDFLKVHNRIIETGIEEDNVQSRPKSFKLYQNYPNPFNPVTKIKYMVPKSSHILLKIYNLAGQELEILVNEFQAADEYEIIWQPRGLPSGMYFCKIQVGDPSANSGQSYTETKKLILLK